MKNPYITFLLTFIGIYAANFKTEEVLTYSDSARLEAALGSVLYLQTKLLTVFL